MKLSRRQLAAVAASAAGLSIGRSAAASTDYPKGPVRVVVPFPPGGPTDIVGRVVCQSLSEALRQPFVVENRAGAGGIIGADQVAKARPDGQTLLINVSSHVINPALYSRLPHDPLADFAPITGLGSTPIQLVVASSPPVRSVEDLVRHIRTNPGRCSFASSSNGTPGHLAGELFKLATGVEALHVPYKGSAPALTGLLGGQVTYMFDSMPSSLPLVQSGALRALAVTAARRVRDLPDVPTTSELGFGEITFTTWYGMWAPARTPTEIVDRLQAEVASALSRPDVRARLAELSTEAMSEAPARFAAFCRSEAERYAGIVRDANIRIE
jgi:tripartite-type tricarboxylate transporter receptor subunit TctC